MNKQDQLIAEILSAHESACKEPSVGTWRGEGDKLVCQLVIDPFYTGVDLKRECVARRQLEVLEEYFYENHYDMWCGSPLCLPEIVVPNTRRQWMIERIRWCLGQRATDE